MRAIPQSALVLCSPVIIIEEEVKVAVVEARIIATGAAQLQLHRIAGLGVDLGRD